MAYTGDRARKIIRDESLLYRQSGPAERLLFNVIAVGWALFQLALPSFVVLERTIVRSVHLSFALLLCFVLVPAIKRKISFGQLTIDPARTGPAAYLLAISGVLCALYMVFDYEGLSARAGMPVERDIAIGLLLIVLVLEGARRVLGPALSIIAIIFTIYAFLGPHMPDILAFKGVSLNKYTGNIALSTEGIYGIPLGVSASIVYLFVLMGSMLERAGAGSFFTELAISLLGRFKGGAAKAAVAASGATGMVSGSSIANIVTTGPFTIPLMKKTGYPPEKAAAVEVAASTDGQLMPPIMGAAAFIIAEYVNVPYMEVVKAAIVPALASYFGLFCITHLEASKLGISALPKEELPQFFRVLKAGAHYLIAPLVLLIELVWFRHSPELAAFRSIIALTLVILYQEGLRAYREKSGPGKALANALGIIVSGMAEGSRKMVPVALACAGAGIIVGIVNMGIGGMLAQVVEALSGGNIYLMLFITAAASLLLGMGLPTTATYIVMASLTAPVMVKVAGLYGFMVPLMAAHLFCFYFGILADDTPPVGLAAYSASAIANSEPIRTGIQGFLYDIRTSVIAFLFVLNPELILDGIESWQRGILILSMALVGMSAFECAAQGWCVRKNRWYEPPVFLLAALALFYPGALAETLPVALPHKYLVFIFGLTLYALMFLWQRATKMA